MDELKEELKEEKTDYYSIINKNIKTMRKHFRVLCFQIDIIFLVVLLYIHFFGHVYDFVIYFCFGITISIMFNVSLVLVKKFNIIASKKFSEKYTPSIIKSTIQSIIKGSNNYLNEELTLLSGAVGNILLHLIFSILAFIYVKNYIKNSVKTNITILISVILYVAFFYYNIYINNTFKIYNKSIELTKTEFNTLIISITLFYCGLLYYFETIKNERHN